MAKRLFLAALLPLLLNACAYYVDTSGQNGWLRKVTVIGYGTAGNDEGYSAAQRRLLAMRASKVDAYRNLAEQVYGLQINGHTTVSDMVVENDHHRSYVDAVVRGAQVRSVTPMDDGSFETVLELELGPSFLDCLTAPGQRPAHCTSSFNSVTQCGEDGCHSTPIFVYYGAGQAQTMDAEAPQ